MKINLIVIVRRVWLECLRNILQTETRRKRKKKRQIDGRQEILKGGFPRRKERTSCGSKTRKELPPQD